MSNLIAEAKVHGTGVVVVVRNRRKTNYNDLRSRANRQAELTRAEMKAFIAQCIDALLEAERTAAEWKSESAWVAIKTPKTA